MRKILILITVLFVSNFYAQDILPLKERANFINKLQKERFNNLLPDLMDKTDIDMCVLIAREYNEDPVIRTMLPATWLNARRRTILVIRNPGNGLPLETYAVARYDVGEVFKKAWDPEAQPDQYKALADLIKTKDPKKIGLNKSEFFAQADGLTATEYNLFKIH